VVDIPTTWALCDGTNDTPDLRGQFVVGAGDAYAVGDTGGADETDITHTHDVGTLVNDSQGAHVHTISGASASDGSHTHTSGTYATDSDNHTHSSGSYSAASDSHSHGNGSLATNAGTSNILTVDAGSYADVSASNHTHDVTGSTASDSHTHDVSGSSASDSHSHDVTGSSASGGSHTHGAGTYANDSQGAHVHTISGATASGGNATYDNRPAYYALAYIMRIE
jgi:hypothetical protein